MNKQELKGLLKPLLKEIIKEVILEEKGVLSHVIKEVAYSLAGEETETKTKEVPVKETRTNDNKNKFKELKETKEQIIASRKSLAELTGLPETAFSSVKPVKEENTSVPQSGKAKAEAANKERLNDPGININALMETIAGGARNWKGISFDRKKNV